MSEAERRKSYSAERVLIEASRMLTPAFGPQGIYLTGAQVEMLRNIVAYLNRQETFVDTYYDTYYEMAATSDWDTIQALVADLEDKLMANENTVWGYYAGWEENLEIRVGFGGGLAIRTTTPVPAGRVRVLEGVSWQNQTGVRGTMLFRVRPVSNLTLARQTQPAQYDPLLWFGRLTMKEGDYLEVKQPNTLEDDYLIGAAWGYDMIVPE